jgi:hypothetical protein
MGIRFSCPSGHKLNVKSFLAGKRAICPECGAKVMVPETSEVSAGGIPRQDAGVYEMVSGSPGLMSDVTSSVAIDLAESTATTSAVADEFELAMPESIVAVASLPAAVVEPIVADTSIEQELRRARGRRNQMAVAIIMFMVVIVLAGVFVWVLRREAASMKAQETPAAEIPETEKTPEPEKTSWINSSTDIAFDMRERGITNSIQRG